MGWDGLGWWMMVAWAWVWAWAVAYFSCVGRWFLGNPFVHMITQKVQHETETALGEKRKRSHLLTPS